MDGLNNREERAELMDWKRDPKKLCRQRHRKYEERDIWSSRRRTKLQLMGIVDGSRK